MKRILTAITMACVVLLSAHAQKDFNSTQLQLRSSLMSFIADEGYRPSIDSDGDITFKREGHPYYVVISTSDTSPMYLQIYRTFSYGSYYTREFMEKHLNDLNMKKAIKVALWNNSYDVGYETYLTDATVIRQTFDKICSQIDATVEAIEDL